MKPTVLVALFAVSAFQLLFTNTQAQGVIPGYPSGIYQPSIGIYPPSSGDITYPGVYPPMGMGTHIHGPIGAMIHNVFSYARYIITRIFYIPLNIFIKAVRFITMLLGLGVEPYSPFGGYSQ